MEDYPTIGVAFGGGGAKGLAQIGIVRVLEKYGIKIASVAGTSAGSIVGGAVALGDSSAEILKKAEGGVATKKMTKIRNFNIFSESLIKNKVINSGIQEMLGTETTFEDTKIPFLATAVDLESGEEIVIKKGRLWEAARASSAIPMVFSPYFVNGRYCVDGGLLNNVPADHLRRQNLDIVVAIELGGMTTKQFISAMVWNRYYRKPKTFEFYPSFFTKWKMNTALMTQVLLRSLDILREREQRSRYEFAKPDIIIRPKLDAISLLDFGSYKQAITAGVEATENIIPTLLDLIEKKKIEKRKQMAETAVENQKKQ
ncbi:patatin-like phospholipase family protein [Candidatus Peregrinibacteria bacterium]|nr:patatin-like phospholipase family protein [Candidatus Peregrinibacteria bacterium]